MPGKPANRQKSQILLACPFYGFHATYIFRYIFPEGSYVGLENQRFNPFARISFNFFQLNFGLIPWRHFTAFWYLTFFGYSNNGIMKFNSTFSVKRADILPAFFYVCFEAFWIVFISSLLLNICSIFINVVVCAIFLI